MTAGSESEGSSAPARARAHAPAIALAATSHAALLAWGVSRSGASVLELPGGKLVLWAATSALVATLTAALLRASAGLLVVPAVANAGLALVGVDAAAAAGVLPAVAQTARVGALGVALALSLAASSLAARQRSPAASSDTSHRAPLRTGLLSLAAVLVAGIFWSRAILLPAACALVGVLSISAIAMRPSSGLRPERMVELLAASVFSLGAVWSACIVVGRESAPLAQGASVALPAMRFAWLAALPVLATTAVAVVPRAALFGTGVIHHPRLAIAATLGVVMCMGIGRGTSQTALAAAARLSQPSVEPREVRDESDPTSVAALPSAAKPATSDASIAPARASVATPVASEAPAGPEADGVELLDGPELSTASARVTARFTLDGPLAKADAVGGLSKAIERMLTCYEESASMGEAIEARLRLHVASDGSVRQADPDPGSTQDEELLTCVALSLYRVGLAGAPEATNIHLRLDFSPAS